MDKKHNSIVETLERDGKLVYKVKGVSMLPLIRQDRDVIYIVKRPAGQTISVGEVVLFRRGEKLVLHRVIGRNGDDYVICGDNQYVPELVRDEQIIGVMTAFIRKGNTCYTNDEKYLKYVNKMLAMPMKRRKLMVRIRSITERIRRHTFTHNANG